MKIKEKKDLRSLTHSDLFLKPSLRAPPFKNFDFYDLCK
jgi:hypothetical protein